MKIFKILSLFLLTISLFSCSSDSSSDHSSADYFNLTYKGQAKTVTSWQAIKQDDHIEVAADTQDGLGISFKFNTYGNLYESFTHPNTAESTVEFQAASAYFRSNTFTFTLVDLNTADKTITVGFSGKVYDNEYDLTSDFSTVSGSFKVTYMVLAPSISGLGTYAKINGTDWHGLENSSSSSSSDDTTVLNIQNDSEYNIGISYPYFAPVAGTFAFDSNTDNKRITFSKYDTTTHMPVEYNVNGTITYTTANSTYVQGTFSLTATHPTNGSTITITNGTFKEASAD